MTQFTKTLKILFLVTSLISFRTQVFAVGSGGYENQVPGARAMGRANAMVATADDSSATTFNPARLTSVPNTDISLGVTMQNLKTDYDDQAGTKDSADHDTAYSPNFGIASHLGLEKWGFGLGVNIPYGLSTKWGDNSPLRYIATESNLSILDINPAVAYQVHPNFSIGAGLDIYNVSNVDLKSRVNVSGLNQQLGGLGGEPDGDQQLEGDGSDVGFNLGLAGHIENKHFFGLSYRSGANVDVKGNLKLHGLSNESAFVFNGTDYQTSVESKVVIPKQVQLGYGYKIREGLVVEFDGEWDRWSAFKDQNVKFGETDPTISGILNASNPTPKNWNNSWSFGIGTEYAFTDKFSLRGGYGFFDSPVPNETFEASTPDSDLHMFTLGAGYKFNPIKVDLALQYFKLNDRHIENQVGAGSGSTGNGTYKSSAMYYGINIGYEFGKN